MQIDFAGNGWDFPEDKRSRSYNQSPALLGQSTTRELMADFLIRMGREGEKWARALRGVIHDAVVVDLPQETVDEDAKFVADLMQADYDQIGRASCRESGWISVGVGREIKRA